MKMKAALWVVCALVGSCKSKPGDACKTGVAECQDSQTKLACQSGKIMVQPCKGPKGCYTAGDKLGCDVSGNAAGDPCSTDEEGKGECSADGKSLVACMGGKFEHVPCRGKGACKTSGDSSKCDSFVAQVGDVCLNAKGACSEDGKSMLECKDHKFVLDKPCHGKKGCTDAGDSLSCDRSLADVGEPCGAGATGGACSLDGKALHSCKDGKFVFTKACRGPKGCEDKGESLNCDQSVAEVGDACTAAGATCRLDRKAIISCENGKFAVSSECKQGTSCKDVGDDKIGCGP